MRTVVWGLLWLVSLTLWVPPGVAAERSTSTGWHLLDVVLVAALVLPIPSSFAWGVRLGRTSRWDVGLISVPLGGIALMSAYVLAFILGPDVNADEEAAVGIFVVGPPALLGILVFVALGYGAGVAWRRWRSRRRDRAVAAAVPPPTAPQA